MALVQASEEEKIKKTLQANIIRSNGRKYNLCLFLKFNGNKETVRKYLNKLLLYKDSIYAVTSAQKQDCLYEQSKRKGEKASSNPEMINCVFITYDGVSFFLDKKEQLDLDFLNKDFRKSFKRGIRRNIPFNGILKGNHWKNKIHVMILFADNDLCKLRHTHQYLEEQFSKLKFIKIVRGEYGDRDDEGFFGFKEGKIKADIWNYSSGAPVLDTKKLKNSFIFKDFEDGKEEGWGSMFVFTKFQHRKSVFEAKIKMLQNSSTNKELAKAKILGKYYNGLPLEVSTKESDFKLQRFEEKSKLFDRNLLKYSENSGCPLGAHIRKMNTRNDNDIDSVFETENSKSPYKRQLIRRGIGYSSRNKKVRGLLFMSYQTSISNQFEKLLLVWGVAGFPGKDACQDEVISSCYFRGGEYFYAPSIAFLKYVLLAEQTTTKQ